MWTLTGVLRACDKMQHRPPRKRRGRGVRVGFRERVGEEDWGDGLVLGKLSKQVWESENRVDTSMI